MGCIGGMYGKETQMSLDELISYAKDLRKDHTGDTEITILSNGAVESVNAVFISTLVGGQYDGMPVLVFVPISSMDHFKTLDAQP
jgi:hypothetical protein